MPKNNTGDILDCDWNPIIGCERYSIGCKKCWYIEGIFPWQKRLGNIPVDVLENQFYIFEKRMSSSHLKTKRGVIGICQHGDLFWEKVPDSTIHQVLDTIETVAPQRPNNKYVLWTKRAHRMADILSSRYLLGLPSNFACSVSIENQALADERIPDLLRINGLKIAMMEPMIGPIDITPYIRNLDWIVVGSETGLSSTPLQLDWVRKVRDYTKSEGIPFFIKQLGNNHKHPARILDDRTWDEKPTGF